MERIMTGWNIAWNKYYRIFMSLSLLKKISLSITFTFLTAFSGQVYIKTGFTPVPFTGQVFVVLLSGILLGKNFGGLSQLLYLLGGCAGINWFYGLGLGFSRYTTGYIIGFVLASYIVGFLSEKKNDKINNFLIMVYGIFIIHLAGLLWLAPFMRISFQKAFLIGALPFLPFDIIKAYFAGLIAKSILKNRGSNEKV